MTRPTTAQQLLNDLTQRTRQRLSMIGEPDSHDYSWYVKELRRRVEKFDRNNIYRRSGTNFSAAVARPLTATEEHVKQIFDLLGEWDSFLGVALELQLATAQLSVVPTLD